MKKNVNVRGYVKSIKSVVQTLENASNTDKIIRNTGQLIASNSNQVPDSIESQLKSNLEKTKAPETHTSIDLLLIAVRTGYGRNFLPMYESCRQKIANKYGKVWLEVLQPTSIEISRIDGILEVGPHSSKTYEVANQITSMQNKSDQEILKILENNLVSDQSPDISGGIYSMGTMFAQPPVYDKLKSSNPQSVQFNSPNPKSRSSKPQNIEPQCIEPQNIEPQIANTPNSSPGSSFDFVETYEDVIEATEFENEVGTPEHDIDEERGPVCSLTLATTPDSSPGPGSDFDEDEFDDDEFDLDVQIGSLNILDILRPNIQVNSVRLPHSTSPLLEPSEGTYTNIVWFVKSFFTHNVEFIG